MADLIQVKRALISVSDKAGIQELGKELQLQGIAIVSTGSTAQVLRESGINVTAVEEITGFPESFDGRVKTLHPKIHGGILANRQLESHSKELANLGIEAFDLLVANLYPFQETVSSGASFESVIEQIDVGGPALIRGAAKNHANIAVITNPAQYPELLEQIRGGGTTLETRKAWAARAFSLTAAYDIAISDWFSANNLSSTSREFPNDLVLQYKQVQKLRYGENSHQRAALYRSTNLDSNSGIVSARQLAGKEMSFNNFLDSEAALRCVLDFKSTAVAIMKHNNPCGIAAGDGDSSLLEIYLRAHESDPTSAFGGVIAINQVVDQATASAIAETFTEVLIAPGFEAAALAVLKEKKHLRILEVPAQLHQSATELRFVSGGLLVQDRDIGSHSKIADWSLVSGEPARGSAVGDLEFAWKSCKFVKSNAILIASNLASVGIGMGQVNRVDSCRLAVERAGSRAAGAVAASDAFFPFADGLEILIRAGVTSVVQPGGSIRDAEVIAAAQKAGITMYFAGERHFLH